MTLLEHFTEETKTYFLLALKEADRAAFLGKLPIPYLNCYVLANDLDVRVAQFGKTRAEEISQLIPTRPNIKSGDFGEILSYFLIREKNQNRKVEGPLKWRWKQERDVAAPYTDVILHSINNPDKPNPEDLLISVESKMKSTKNNNYHPIQHALDGAGKDHVTRIAQSLGWLRRKYVEEAGKADAPIDELKKIVKKIERFINSESLGEYKKELVALAIIEHTFIEDEIKKPVIKPNTDSIPLETIVVSIKGLKNVYELTFEDLLKL